MLASDGQNKVPEAIWTVEAGQPVIQPAVTVGRSLLLATQDSRLKSDKSRVQAFDLGDGLIHYFSRTDLDLIIIELGLTREDFSPKLSLMTKELITTMARSGRVEELIKICRSKRPNVAW